jgi:hypothetical protein
MGQRCQLLVGISKCDPLTFSTSLSPSSGLIVEFASERIGIVEGMQSQGGARENKSS